MPVSVNLSARSLLDPPLPAEVAELLRRHSVPPHRLVLEITETVVMSELEVIDEVLGALRRWASSSPSTTSAPASRR